MVARLAKDDLKNDLLDAYEANGKPMSQISFMDLVKGVEVELSKNTKLKLMKVSD